MKTLKQICRACHISRSGLFKRIHNIKGFQKNHMRKYKGTWYIDDNAVSAINAKKYAHVPKHYKHPIDHPKTRYDVERENQRMRKEADKLLNIIASQQKTIQSQQRLFDKKL